MFLVFFLVWSFSKDCCCFPLPAPPSSRLRQRPPHFAVAQVCFLSCFETHNPTRPDPTQTLPTQQDVLLLCSDPRKLVCAFQDAWGMLEAAGRTLAPSVKAFQPAANGGGGGGKGKKAQRRAAKELGKVEKRIGYFLLWARSHGAEVAPQMLKAVEVPPEVVQRRAVTIAA